MGKQNALSLKILCVLRYAERTILKKEMLRLLILLRWKEIVFFGEEIAPSTGLRHLQGFIVMSRRIRFAPLKSKVGVKFYLTHINGTIEQNIEYCSKEGNVKELGDKSLIEREKNP